MLKILKMKRSGEVADALPHSADFLRISGGGGAK